MRRALIVTGHFPEQKRRANIPWLADRMRAEGWHVTFVTVGYSWISRLTGERRIAALDRVPATGMRRIDPSLTALFHYAPIHPFSLRHGGLDRIVAPLHGGFARFWGPRLAPVAARSDLIVVESGPPLMLAPGLRRAAPDVPMVYRVSDDVRLLGLPEVLTGAEMTYAPLFDRISVASPILARRWQGHRGLAIDPIGVPKADLMLTQADPYPAPRAGIEAVCAGTTLFDMGQAIAIAQARPDWRVSVIGRLKQSPPARVPGNLRFLGERGFDETVAHIRHADIGLAIYADVAGVEYQTAQSNRILLYRHFRLPVLGPRRLCDPVLPSIIGYDAGDADSIRVAAQQAMDLPPQPEDLTIPDWGALYERIAGTVRIRTE